MTHAANQKALQWYERSADYYAGLLGPRPPAKLAAPLRKLAELVGAGGTILEVGSGPGRDADYLETFGVRVRRTDATAAFVEMQRARGKDAERLDIITDEFGGPYQGALAYSVLLHVSAELTDQVLGKVAGALAPGGAFLTSVRASHSASDGPDISWWKHRDDFAVRLQRAGLRIDWDDHFVDSDDDAWWLFIAVKD